MKRLIALVLILAGLIVAAIAAAPFIAATDFAKQRIAAQIAEWTGHPVSFAGEPRVELFPFLSLTIENAHIGGIDADAGEPFVSMDRLTCKLRLLPFLLGRVDVAEFQLVRPHFRLAIAPDGGANWLIDREAAGTEQKPAPRTSNRRDSKRLAETRLGRFNIVDGLVTYEDARNGRHEEFSGVSANLTWPRGKDSVSGSGAFQWRSETVEFNVSVTNPLDLLAGGTSPARFAVASRPIRFSFTGMMDTEGAARMEGPATVTTPSVRRVFQWLGMTMDEGAILGAGLIDGPLTWQGQKASFADAQLELDGNVARGSFAVDFTEQRPRIDAALAFQRLDLTAYLESLQSIDRVSAWPSVPALLPLLDIADARTELTADEILIGTARLGKSSASVEVTGDGISLHLGEANLYGGSLTADARLAVDAGRLSGEADLAIDGSELGMILDQIGVSRAVDGVLTGTAKISAAGATLEEIAESAGGSARFGITGGALDGFDLSEFAALSGAPGVDDPEPEKDRIPFKTLSGSLALTGAVLTSNDLHIAGDTFEASLNARLGLATSAIRARGTLEVARASNSPKIRNVPFTIGGSWDGPVLLPDYERLIEGNAEERGIPPTGDSSPGFAAPRG